MKINSGFTLLELIIVLSLASLILGLAVIFYANTLPSSKLNATARELSATIRYAKHLAQVNGEKQSLTIDLYSRQYGIEGQRSKQVPPEISIKVMDQLSGEVYKGKYLIVFYPHGGVEGGTIVLSTTKKTVSIQLDPVVGSVVIK